jgi:hypothetical protein
MKEKNPIPQYLLDETKEMSDKYKNKVNFTLEELDQLIHDYQHVLKQLEQLEEAKEYGAISKNEASVTKIMLLAKQLVLCSAAEKARDFIGKEQSRIANSLTDMLGN